MTHPDHQRAIPNIDLGKSYDKRYEDADIHVDTLHNLSEFFGREMHPHRHDRYYQVHYLQTGSAQVQLGDQSFAGKAPLFFFTPAAVPHAFVLDESVTGLLLTIRQDVIHRLSTGSDAAVVAHTFTTPAYVELARVNRELAADAQRLAVLIQLLADEFFAARPGRKHTVPALTQAALICVFRLAQLPERGEPLREIELQIFQQFNQLIEAHHAEHWPLAQYAGQLNVTGSRLASICRHISGESPKTLVHAKQIEEAKWRLIYTTSAVSTIAAELGFADPAYFSRFFTRQAGVTPSDFRQTALSGGRHSP